TLPVNTDDFSVSNVCIWNPKYPPYVFRIIFPSGEQITLDPTGQGNNDSWFCQIPPQAISDYKGIWVVDVHLKNTPALPQSINGSNANLNPDMLNINDYFGRQPLIKVVGAETGTVCPEIGEIEIVSGCAAGDVTLKVDILPSQLVDIEELTWEFGDGSFSTYGPGYADGEVSHGLQVTHTYSAALDNQGDNWKATATILRHQGCIPRSRTSEITIPTCPIHCPVIGAVEIVSDHNCTPGTIKFRATVSNSYPTMSYFWNFGDGSETVESNSNEVEHHYASSETYQVSVDISVPDNCQPASGHITVHPCQQDDNGGDNGGDNGDDNGGGFNWCSLWLWLWIFSLLTATILVAMGIYYGAFVYIAYLVFLALWVAMCCWPCARTPWRCCGFLQWHFIALTWLEVVLPILGLAGYPTAWVEFAIVTVLLVLIWIALGTANCRIPVPFLPGTYPGPRCGTEFWLRR
ncbi:MAG: PKD domain-containing protein, partial [Planctomycetota bacterium]